jgi:hypothetical protein
MKLTRSRVLEHQENPDILKRRGQQEGVSYTKLQKVVKPVAMVHAYHPSYLGGLNRKIVVQASPGKNARPYLKK